MNIYDGCIEVSDTFYREYDTSWDEQLDKKRQEYEAKGYKVVFLFAANSFQDAAKALLYNKEQHLPEHIQNYKYKYVRLNNHWVLEARLGIWDKCGEYTPLVCRCREGHLCQDCDKNIDI